MAREKKRYNKKELKEFDEIVTGKLIEAREQLEFYIRSLKERSESDQTKVKGLEDGGNSIEDERLSTLAARQTKLILHLENAKLRIDNGVYGICRETGSLISSERLKAVPHATLSIGAKQKNSR